MTPDNTRRLWLLPHEKLLLRAFNPLRARNHETNEGGQRMLQEHGPGGAMVAMAGALDGLIGFALGLVGVVMLAVSLCGWAYLFLLVGLASALLAGYTRLADHHHAGRRRPGMVTEGVTVVSP